VANGNHNFDNEKSAWNAYGLDVMTAYNANVMIHLELDYTIACMNDIRCCICFVGA
jgi:hypothetical protein